MHRLQVDQNSSQIYFRYTFLFVAHLLLHFLQYYVRIILTSSEIKRQISFYDDMYHEKL